MRLLFSISGERHKDIADLISLSFFRACCIFADISLCIFVSISVFFRHIYHSQIIAQNSNDFSQLAFEQECGLQSRRSSCLWRQNISSELLHRAWRCCGRSGTALSFYGPFCLSIYAAFSFFLSLSLFFTLILLISLAPLPL